MKTRARRTAKRLRAVQAFQVLSCTQFTLGFLLLFFGSYSITYHTWSTRTPLPYYSGAFTSGVMVLILGMAGGAVFHKSHTAKTEKLAETEPKQAMSIYIWTTPLTTAACIAGASLTSVYGFCLKEDLCSYSTKEKLNIGMAILLFALETLSFLTCLFSYILIGKYAKIFGVTCECGSGGSANTGSDASEKNGSNASAVRSGAMDVVNTNNASDELAKEKHEEKIDRDVDFEKIRHIRAVSRQGERSHTMTIRFEEENSGFHLFTPRRNINR